ncbi:MAG: hypothetical protein BWY75_03678 [bacterium ADurb.Bin425]|nr:MAG: hypothetical protein BWY75_03678 [bacterium ADurb.Bin425]
MIDGITVHICNKAQLRTQKIANPFDSDFLDNLCTKPRSRQGCKRRRYWHISLVLAFFAICRHRSATALNTSTYTSGNR